jgi:hypothetical protein
MNPQSVWSVRDVVNIVAIVVGPLFAVLITLWWQHRKEKRDAKLRLFATLMAFRKSVTGVIKPEWVNSLNLIDVVFADSPKVVDRWHEYYTLLLRQNPSPQEMETQVHKYIELMSVMAETLGIALQQIDIEKFYTPMAHGLEAERNAALSAELLRVLQNTERISVVPRQASLPTVQAGPPQLKQ